MAAVLSAALVLAGSAVLPLPGLDAITAARYPDAHAVIVDQRERVRYNPDGTYESEVEVWTKLMTEKGRRDEQVQTLDYSRRYGEAAFVSVGIIGTNGVERSVDVSQTTKESTDNASMSANIYDPLDRKIVCTVPGLAVGETLHVKTRRRALHARCEGQWADISVLEWSSPIVRASYEVTAPAARPLGNIKIRHPLGNLVTNVTRQAGGDLVYSFVVTNSPQAIPEPDMPALHTQVQHVRVSTAACWEDISKWYWGLCAPHLAKTSPALVAKAKELASFPGRLDNLRAVYRFVSQEVRYMGLTLEDVSPGYSPHDVDITFANRYGVCRDKAALLVAMLRSVGFEAYPVLIQVGTKHDEEVPQPFFNHAIVAVVDKELGDGYVLMDPTDENSKDLLPSYLCDMSYLVCRPDGERLLTTPVPDPRANAVEATTRAALTEDGSLVVDSELDFTGINDTAYRHALVRQKPEDRVKFFEQVVKAIAAGADLTACRIEPEDLRDTERALKVRLSAKLPECVLRGATRQVLTVPFVSAGLGVANFLLDGSFPLPQRRYPLKISSTARVHETLTVDLGGGLGDALELPSAEIAVGDGFRYLRRFVSTNGTLRCARELSIGALEFSPKTYGDLREAVKETEAAARKRPVFAVDEAQGADMRMIFRSDETTTDGDYTWVTTNRVVMEVLSYKGKKRFSELSCSYNPTWEGVQLLSASVSNRDGRVTHVTPREINTMDCAWAAAAPRYPAGRLMVVSFPAVEIGSVIDYTFVSTATNAPAPFHESYAFYSHEPLGVRRVRVDDWVREVSHPRRIKNEPNQPAAADWLDVETIARDSFAAAAARLRQVEPAARAEGKGRSLREIRDWMAKNVKLAGPTLYELPVELQLTDPAQVLKERYATRLDYVRTLTALVKGAGYEASVVFAADDADDSERDKRRTMYDRPNVRAYSAALCRVRDGDRTLFVGAENQYAPLGTSSYAGSTYLDPATGEFGLVEVAPEFRGLTEERTEYEVREDGSVDLTMEHRIFGAAVAGFRKTYSEILPEMRQRRYQEILGGIAQAAQATSELETDVEGYPAVRRFSCYIPDYAAVDGDLITLQLPALLSSIPAYTGKARVTPFAVGASEEQTETVVVRFPRGYVTVEHLPDSFAFANPDCPDEGVWLTGDVNSFVADDVLTVVIRRRVHRRRSGFFAGKYYELIKDWNRIAGSLASRTIVIRKTPLSKDTSICYTNQVFASKEATLAQ